MCGRARLATDYSELKIQFRIPLDSPTPNVPARWNAAPTQSMVVVRFDQAANARRLDAMRWGLIPTWAKDIKIGYSTFNAMAETVAEKPAFRAAYRQRRCLVPLDGFYEWKKLGPKDKQPYTIARADGRIMAVAGLWEQWNGPAEKLMSFTVITCPANPRMSTLHTRMPVILEPDDWAAWLGEAPAEPGELRALLRPCADTVLDLWPVDKRVGNGKNDDPSLAARLEA